MFVTSMCLMHAILSCAQSYTGTYSRHYQHLFSALQNQAGLAFVPLSVGVSTERRFMLKELSTHSAAVAIPAYSGTFAFSLEQKGYNVYHEQKAGIAYGRSLGTKLSIGMQIDYLSKVIRQYSNQQDITFELGCLLHLTSQLHAGVHVFNPGVYTAGFGYEVSDVFMVSTVVIQQNDQHIISKFMCEYHFIPQFSFQLGLSADPQLSSAAVSFTSKQMQIYLTASHHPQLGFSPATSIIWQWKKKVA